MMDHLITVVVLSVVGATGAARWGLRYLERRRTRAALRAKPELDPSTPDGTPVRITGVVRALETLTSPLDGVECVVHWSRVEIRPNIPGRRTFETVAVTPFLVEREGAESVLVEGTGAQLDLPPTLQGRPDPVRSEQFLRHHGARTLGGEPVYSETVVVPGQRIAVAGLLMVDPALEPTTDERGFRDQPRPRLRLTGNAEHPLAIGAPED